MTNAMIGYRDAIRSGSLSVGSETSAQPGTNLQSDHGADAWQTGGGVVTSAAGAWVLIDAGSPSQTWRAVLLSRTNLTSAATWRVRIAAASTMAIPAYDSGTVSAGVVPGYGQAVLVLPSEITGRYLRIDLDDAVNPDGSLRVGNAWAGPVWQPTRNFSYGAGIGRDEGTTEVVTKGGQEFPTNDWTRRAWDVAFDFLDDEEGYPEALEIDRVARLGGNLLFVPRPAGPFLAREAVLGRFRPASRIGLQAYGLNSFRFTVTERL
jgi:hypothetical protein